MNLFLGDPLDDDAFEPFDDDVFLDCGWDDDPRDRAPALTLGPAQRVAMVSAVEAALRARGCDNTLRAARTWAASAAGVSWPRLRAELEGNGGYCDCEILFNVLPSEEPEPD